MSFAGLKGFMRLLDESPSRILVFGLPSVSTLYDAVQRRSKLNK